MVVCGRIQREAAVVYRSPGSQTSRRISSVSNRDAAFPLSHNGATRSVTVLPVPTSRATAKGVHTRDIYIPDLHIDPIKVKCATFA
jgi:error-prone DNA polymerase